MPFDFSVPGLEGEDVQLEVAQPQQPTPTVTEFDQELGLSASPEDALLSEAENRFLKAQYYRTLITHPIFGDDQTAPAMDVFREIQEFSRERLSVLLGLKAEAQAAKIESPFSLDQVKVLQEVADRLLKKPNLLTPPTPTIQKAESPRQPAVKPVRPATPAVKPVAKNPPAAQPKPQQQAAAAPKPKTPPKRQGQATGEWIEIETVDKSRPEGVAKTKYQKFIDPKHGEYYQGPNGQFYLLMVNDMGTQYMRSISRQARPVGVQPVPPLNTNTMAAVAASQVQTAMSLDPVASGRATGGRPVITPNITPE